MIVKERDCVETRAAKVKRKSADPMKALSANLKRQREGKKLKCISPKETDDTSENAQIRSLYIQPRYINTLESSNRASDVRIHLFTRRFPKRKFPQQQAARLEKTKKSARARERKREETRDARYFILHSRSRFVFCSDARTQNKDVIVAGQRREKRTLAIFCFVYIVCVEVFEAQGGGETGLLGSGEAEC